jgi:lipoate-protein ligase A
MTIAELTAPPAALETWQIISTPPMPGADNMAYDLATLHKMQQPDTSPVLRFFSWDRPEATFGKHQSAEALSARIPAELNAVRRPTGGGLVIHGQDLCLSLCWRAGQAPLPARMKDHYAWIHGVIWEAILPLTDAQLATCRDCAVPAPFPIRECFTEPVAYDIIRGRQKITGGALCRIKNAFLYQGSIQGFTENNPALREDLQSRLHSHFHRYLNRAATSAG